MELIFDNTKLIIFVLFTLYLVTSIALELKQQSRFFKEKRADRGSADICLFARTFDYRTIDTKIIREVWNEIQLNITNSKSEPFPIQAEDNICKDYFFDEDDLDDSYWRICDRLGIDSESELAVNPFYDKVDTVKDLVLFLHHQPRLSA